MEPSKELKAMSIENSPKTGVTAEGRAAAKRIAAARAERDANPTSVTADQLSQPVSQVTVPQPGQAPTSNPRTNALVGSTLGGIRSMSESAQRLRDQNEQLNAFSEDFSAVNLNDQFLNRFGVTEERLGRLEQLENQLNSFDAESKIVQSRIASAPGQTAGQAGREITQEDRELAIRSAETASEAEILRGNISLGRELARDAVNLAITDRNFRADSMIRQIKSLEGIVDEETRQLLVAEERQYTEIKDRGEELRTSITDAVSSGAATPEEVRQLNALSEPQRADESTEQYFARVRAEDAAKLAAAQGIVSRGQTQMRDLDVQAKRAGIARDYSAINLAERKFNYEQQQDKLDAELKAMVESGAISVEDAAKQGKVESALRLKDLISQIRGHAGFNLSVGSVGSRIVGLEGGVVGQLFNYLSGQGEGFDGLYDQLTESLTLDNLDKMSGVLTDRDIQVLRDAGTRLRKTTTEAEFLGVLDEMDSIFQRTIDETGITPEQARFYFEADDDTMLEVDNIWGDTAATTVNSLDNDTY